MTFDRAYLEVWARDTTCQLPKQRLHDLLKLCRFNNIKNLLQLSQEHHLTTTAPLSTENQRCYGLYTQQQTITNADDTKIKGDIQWRIRNLTIPLLPLKRATLQSILSLQKMHWQKCYHYKPPVRRQFNGKQYCITNYWTYLFLTTSFGPKLE